MSSVFSIEADGISEVLEDEGHDEEEPTASTVQMDESDSSAVSLSSRWGTGFDGGPGAVLVADGGTDWIAAFSAGVAAVESGKIRSPLRAGAQR